MPVRHGLRDGRDPAEVLAHVPGARKGIERALRELGWMDGRACLASVSGYGVLARAGRAKRPGVVFARAAARKETDPLEDDHSRVFVGLPLTKGD